MDATPQELDLTPEIINIELQQGADAVLTFQLTNNAGVAVDLTLDTVKFSAKDGFAGATMIATKTNGPGQHETPLTGMTTFVLTKANLTVAEADSQTTWKYEIRRIVATSLREIIYIHGDLTLMPSVGVTS